LERLGFAPERLLAANPKLVIIRLSGWGQTGPYRDRPGFGTLVEAMSGYAELNGFPSSPPLLPPLAMADMVAGLYAAVALLSALRVVEAGGKGQVVDISLFEPIFSFISTEAAQYALTGKPTPRTGNQSSHTAPRNAYLCADGKYVALSASMQSMAERLFRAIGRPDLIDDPRFRTNDDRVQNRDALDQIIGDVIRQQTREENLRLFEAAEVTVGPILSVAELLGHPFTRGRGIIAEVGADGEKLPMHGVVPRFSATPGRVARPAPALGQHTEEVLGSLKSAKAVEGDITRKAKTARNDP
jgi:crotonobetainyl-CoA:carnitine CoA-transferase CaiB-like acyl-CoA transferase